MTAHKRPPSYSSGRGPLDSDLTKQGGGRQMVWYW